MNLLTNLKENLQLLIKNHCQGNSYIQFNLNVIENYFSVFINMNNTNILFK